MPALSRFKPAAALVLSLAALPSPSLAEGSRYLLATAGQGGSYYPVGVALALVATIHLRGSQGIEIEAIPTNGSVENAALLRSGEVQFALMQTQVGAWARDGAGPLAEAGPDEDLRAVAMLWPDLAHYLLRSDLAETGTIADLARLDGLGFGIGAPGSGSEQANRALLAGFGLPVDGWGVAQMGFAETAQSLARGDLAGAGFLTGLGSEAVVHAMAHMGEGVTLLSVPPDQAAAVADPDGHVVAATIPGGAYAGQAAAVPTVGVANFLAVRADLPEEDVHAVTRVIFENLTYLCQLHPAGCALSAQAATEGLPVPQHPGAARYFSALAPASGE